jgi:hypothetical protein
VLVQALADLAAEAEGRPRRPVPPPEHPLVLPDQLEVMTADLLRLDEPGILVRAAAAVDEARRQI